MPHDPPTPSHSNAGDGKRSRSPSSLVAVDAIRITFPPAGGEAMSRQQTSLWPTRQDGMNPKPVASIPRSHRITQALAAAVEASGRAIAPRNGIAHEDPLCAVDCPGVERPDKDDATHAMSANINPWQTKDAAAKKINRLGQARTQQKVQRVHATLLVTTAVPCSYL